MARGTIVKKGLNYYIVYRVDGKQKWKTAGDNKKRAEKILTEIMAQIHSGGYQEIKEITFSEFAKKWLKDYAEGRVKASTYRFYKDIIAIHLVPFFGEFRLQSITTHMIEEFLTTKRRETELSATTISYHLRVMKTVLKRAIIWGYLAKNPAEHIEKPRIKRKEMDFLTPEELRLFLKNVEAKYYPLFLTAALTGLRRGELLALKWTDINWATSQIHVRRSFVMGKFEEPKSDAATRAIIIPQILVKTLKRHKLSSSTSECDLVFSNKEGKIVDANNLIKRHFQPALRRAGLRTIRFHDLRHSYASILIAQGENLKFIQHQLGHSSAQVTLDRYGHLMPQVQHGVGERLQNTVFGDSVRNLLEESKNPTSKKAGFPS